MSVEIRQRRVLVVEHDEATRELLRLHLALAGFAVDEAADGGTALERVRSKPFDLLILDLELPGIDGFAVCRAIRAGTLNRRTPILILTARDGESDKVLGLESGADDYVTTPFGVRELMARTGALLRRTSRLERRAGPGRRVLSRDVALDGDRRLAVVRGAHVPLTRHEFNLLFVLAARPGIVFSRDALLSTISDADRNATERTIDTLVSRLRRKIERDPQSPELILTAWGVGYKFTDRA